MSDSTPKPTNLSRRKFLQSIGAGGALASLPALASTNSEAGPRPLANKNAGAPRRKPPNVLLIVSDQERGWPDLPGGLGLAAHERLLASGTHFSNFNVNTTPCSPSRSNIYTGQHTQHTGIGTNVGAFPFPSLDTGIPTLGHMLRAQGYYTAYKGKWHLSDIPSDPNVHYGDYSDASQALEPYGFADASHNGIADGSFWYGFKFDGETASEASYWLRQTGAASEQPWFLAVNFVNPHDICWFDDVDHQFARTRMRQFFLSPVMPPPLEGPYAKTWDLPLPTSYYTDDLAGEPWAQTSYRKLCNKIYGHLDRGDERRWRAYQSFYFNCIRDMDRHVGTVLDTLEATNQIDNTIIIYTSDHGEMLGAHGLRQKGPTMYKENVRVPLIVCHPDVAGGGTTEALGSAIDLAPTILSLCGLDADTRAERQPQLKGVDLSEPIAKPAARTERDARGHLYDYDTTLYSDPELTEDFMREGGQVTTFSLLQNLIADGRLLPRLNHPSLFRGVFDGRYKFARYFKPSEYHTPEDWDTLLRHNELELYDTKADPDEIDNLAANPEQHQELIAALNQKTNQLVEHEVGMDDGSSHPGPTFLYQL